MIYLSAGHHLNDPGAIANGARENKLTIELRDLTLQHIPAAQVITDKDTETLAQYINRIQPGSGSVLLEYHFDAGGPSATGMTIIVADNANADSRAFAADLAATGSRILGIRNRGVIAEKQSARGRLGILHTGAGIAALAEVCFITNTDDLAHYNNAKQKLAKAWADLLIKYDALRG